MKSTPPGFAWIPTQDGSHTLYSEEFEENCHSTSGAINETKLHYLEGCRIKEQLKEHSPLNILEIGAGAGIGVLETYQLLKTHPGKIHFYSMELDDRLLHWFIQEYNDLFTLNKTLPLNSGKIFFLESKDKLMDLFFVQGDARKTIVELKKEFPDLKFMAIYQDAFSPKKNPTLWTKEWFKILFDFADSNCLMSTYSSTTVIQKAMDEAGFGVYPGEKFGPKRSSTRAQKGQKTSLEIKEAFLRSPYPALSDDNIELFLRGWKT